MVFRWRSQTAIAFLTLCVRARCAPAFVSTDASRSLATATKSRVSLSSRAGAAPMLPSLRVAVTLFAFLSSWSEARWMLMPFLDSGGIDCPWNSNCPACPASGWMSRASCHSFRRNVWTTYAPGLWLGRTRHLTPPLRITTARLYAAALGSPVTKSRSAGCLPVIWCVAIAAEP